MNKTMPPAKSYNIAVIFPDWYSFLNKTMEGVLSIHSIRNQCRFLNFISTDFSQPIDFPQGYKPDGLLVSYDDDAFDAQWIEDLNIPVVNIFTSVKRTHPSVGMDFKSLAQTAVEHFQQLDFNEVAVIGTKNSDYSAEISSEFSKQCSFRDLPFWSIDIPDGIAPGSWSQIEQEAPDLKRRLTNPTARTGVYAFHDMRGRILVDYCTDLGVKIPEQVGVLGRFDTLNARLCTPELSSVVAPASEIGGLGMQLLINLIDGNPVEDFHPRVKISEVRVRESTVGKNDPDMTILEARSMIRENAGKGLTVDELVQSLPIARSTLDKRYRALTGASPAQHIREIRVEKARQLLLTTKKPVEEIAAEIGFTDTRPFIVFFKREVGENPGEFREKFA